MKTKTTATTIWRHKRDRNINTHHNNNHDQPMTHSRNVHIYVLTMLTIGPANDDGLVWNVGGVVVWWRSVFSVIYGPYIER